MKKKTTLSSDPIFFEPFEEWTEDELKKAIYLRKRYYKASEILKHVKTKLSAKQIVKDPIDNNPLTEKQIQSIFKKNNVEYEEQEEFEFDSGNLNIRIQPLNHRGWKFTEIILEFTDRYKIQAPKNYKKDKNKITIGIIPNGINTFPNNYEVRSLDTASTSEAIVSKIVSLLRSGKFFKVDENDKKKLSFIPLKHLPVNYDQINRWMTNKHPNKPIVTKPSKYIDLIQQLNDY